jgi:hypothetical protein
VRQARTSRSSRRAHDAPALAPGAYDLHDPTRPREGTATRPDLRAGARAHHALRQLDLKPGDRASIVFDQRPFNSDAWRGKLLATVAVYSISGAPTDFLIGGDGRIVWRGHPSALQTWRKDVALEGKIGELLARDRR